MTPAIECQSILAIDTSIDPRSTLDRHLGRPSIDTRSTSRSTDFQFSLTLYGVAIDTSDDHTLDIGRQSIATLRSAVGRMSVVCQ